MAATASSHRISAIGHDDVREAGKSFVAGGLYAAGILAIGGMIATTVTQTALPVLVEVVAPDRMPRYTAHEIARADRFNPDQWSFPEIANAQWTVTVQPASPPAAVDTPMQVATAN